MKQTSSAEANRKSRLFSFLFACCIIWIFVASLVSCCIRPVHASIGTDKAAQVIFHFDDAQRQVFKLHQARFLLISVAENSSKDYNVQALSIMDNGMDAE